jgi:hypothetical protein
VTKARGLLGGAAALAVAGGLGGAVIAATSNGDPGVPPTPGALTFQPVLGAPIDGLIGASRAGEPGEAWAWGSIGASRAFTAFRYTDASGSWQAVPFAGADGAQLPLRVTGGLTSLSPKGGLAVVGTETTPAADQQLVTRDPGGSFAVAPTPTVADDSRTTDSGASRNSGAPSSDSRTSSPSRSDNGTSSPSDGDSGALSSTDAQSTSSDATGAVVSSAAVRGVDDGERGDLDAGPVGAAADPPRSGDPADSDTADGDADAVLAPGEELFDDSSSYLPTVAAVDEANGHTGALIAPLRGGTATAAPGIVHFDGLRWTREPVCLDFASGSCNAPRSFVSPTIVADGLDSAWLMANVVGRPVLFKRGTNPDGAPAWIAHTPQTWILGNGAAPAGTTIASRDLTVTNQGVWVDADLTQTASTGQTRGSGTFFVPSSEPDGAPLGTWCYPVALCPGATGSLGAPLPTASGAKIAASYSTTAFAGSSSGDLGARIISGLPNGALLRFNGRGDFQYTVGGNAGGTTAAFSTPDAGWMRGGADNASVVRVSTSTQPSLLTSWPVPFRHPLLAITTEPGATSGDANAQALAVGALGQIARYTPGEGWRPEFLYDATGAVSTPQLRGVAWPQTGRAYAVGDGGAMWVWRSDTNLWEPDPAKPLNFHGNMSAIAFSPTDSSLGFAVGKQGVLLRYGRSWTQEQLPPGLDQADFTSVAFAGSEALVAYHLPGGQRGGLLVNDGTGWRIDDGDGDQVLTRVSGLLDGGAVAAGPNTVIERDSATGPWRPSTQPLEARDISALAAFREDGAVRALVSVGTDGYSAPSNPQIDQVQPPLPGQPPLLLDPDPLSGNGFLVRETASGWADQQHDAWSEPASTGSADGPDWSDPVLALAVEPDGTQGWAVGGDTGTRLLENSLSRRDPADIQTASVSRLGAGPPPPTGVSVPVTVPAGQVSFALGGGAECAQACADLANSGIGPDQWLSAAVMHASQIPGLRGFLYAGGRIATVDAAGQPLPPLDANAFARELQRYEEVLNPRGALATYAAISPGELSPGGDVVPFANALGRSAPVASAPVGTMPPPAGTAAYAFDSSGDGGTVRVIVLDYSRLALGDAQQQWLDVELDDARRRRTPAIVLGNADLLDANAANHATDGTAVAAALVAHHASAYFFESREKNVQQTLGTAPSAIPAFGTGTLGYVTLPTEADRTEFLGESGFLLTSVDVSRRDPATNVAPVTASLIPNAGELALDATDGLLLRRSRVALFRGLARRPSGGSQLGVGTQAPDPYIPIPNPCAGSSCAQQVPITYRFSSSNPDIADFVAHDPNSTDSHAILQDARGKPIPDPTSGLLCAYNAGTTTVTISAGGLSYSQPVTVLRGSVQQPCGTVPLTNPPDAPTQTVTSSVPPPGRAPFRPTPGVRQTPVRVNVIPPRAPSAPPPTPRPPARTPRAHPGPQPRPPFLAAPLIAAALVQVPPRGAVPPASAFASAPDAAVGHRAGAGAVAGLAAGRGAGERERGRGGGRDDPSHGGVPCRGAYAPARLAARPRVDRRRLGRRRGSAPRPSPPPRRAPSIGSCVRSR